MVERLANFTPDIVNAHYLRAVLPGAKAQFTVRFWNLEEVELQRLMWCLTLEDGLAHKLGKHRYLGFGTLRVRALPESHLIDWNERYDTSALTEGKQPLDRAQWHNPRVVQHHAALRAALTAGVA